jgi:type VI secretion system protein ImpL
MTALVAFQAAVAQAAATLGQSGAGDAGASQALSSAATAKSAAVQLASAFTIDPQGQVHSNVQRLMEEPVSYAEALLTHFGADQINARVRNFCGMVRPTFAKFPFNPGSQIQASIPEVSAILRPGTGSLWTMYNDVLQSALQKQGSSFQQVPGTVRLSPSFVDFFNKAATMSDLLFASGTPEPRYSVTVKPQLSDGTSAVAITLEGDNVRSSRNLQSQRIDWPGANHEARLSAQIGSQDWNLVGPFNSPWAMFQLFYAADTWLQVNNAARAEWNLRSGTQGISLPNGAALKVSVDVTPAASAVLLRRGYLSSMSCSGEAAR